jgi:hypothetical protein
LGTRVNVALGEVVKGGKTVLATLSDPVVAIEVVVEKVEAPAEVKAAPVEKAVAANKPKAANKKKV